MWPDESFFESSSLVSAHDGPRYDSWKTKVRAFEEFKGFKVLIQKKHGISIKKVQFDNGGEHVNVEFNKFLKSEAI